MLRPEPCAECGCPALLTAHPFLSIGTGKPATFAPLRVCETCLPVRSPSRERRVQMTLFGPVVHT